MVVAMRALTWPFLQISHIASRITIRSDEYASWILTNAKSSIPVRTYTHQKFELINF